MIFFVAYLKDASFKQVDKNAKTLTVNIQILDRLLWKLYL